MKQIAEDTYIKTFGNKEVPNFVDDISGEWFTRLGKNYLKEMLYFKRNYNRVGGVWKQMEDGRWFSYPHTIGGK
jgi:hypothetical protein